MEEFLGLRGWAKQGNTKRIFLFRTDSYNTKITLLGNFLRTCIRRGISRLAMLEKPQFT